MEQQPNKIKPMLLSALAQLSTCLIVWNFHIPNPNILLFVVLSAVLVKYGYAAGIVSGLIAFLYTAFFFSTDHSFFLYTSVNFQKLIVVGLGIAANILLIGRLQWQLKRSSMEKMQAEAEEKLQETTESYRAKLYQDVLTGTYNRRYYEDIASRMVGPAGIALIDVDDFKICNDTYGHYAGDMALETAANAIRSCIRNADLLIRYGGDEFLLVLPGIPSDILQAKLEQIRAAVQQATVPGYSHFRLSLSIGGTMQTNTDPMENAVRRADRLMYQAKGRKNAVMVEVPGHNLAALEKLLQNKSQILLVDDSAMNRMMLAEILGDSYHILEAENGRECLETLQAEAGNIALVLLDINMPVMDGFEVLKAMNANHTIEDTPVIMISSDDSDDAIRRSYELGASDYVNRPFDARIVYRRVTNTIKLYAKQRRLVQMVSDQIHARENNTDMLVGVLSHIVEFRNGESGAHVRHIRTITEILLHRLLENSNKYSISAEQQDVIPLASALHDIGKIGIDEKILNKPGKLTPEEFEVMKTHSMLGAEMLHDLDNFGEQPLLQTAYEIARWHHERWDGRGYPDGLKGDEIPISAQLVSLADVYDALTSERCYKKAFSHEKAVQMILNGECGAFNPLLLQCLTDVQADLKEELRQHDWAADAIKTGERKAQMKHRISRRAFLRGCTLLAASAAVGSLTSCGGTDAKDSGLPPIIVGSDTYPPYIYLNNDGVPAGIDVEIATEAFRRMGYAARFESVDWEQKTNLVESGTIDCIWGCFSMDGREEVYRWAGPYMVSRQVVAVDADSSIRTFSDLAGKTIAVQSTGKPEEIFLSGSDPRLPQTVEVFSIEDRNVQYAMMACGYVDAIAAHETGILQYMKDNSVEFRILEEPLLVTGLGVAFAKNDSRGLDHQLNDTFAQMRTDGTLEQILGKYLEHASQYLEVDTLGA